MEKSEKTMPVLELQKLVADTCQYWVTCFWTLTMHAFGMGSQQLGSAHAVFLSIRVNEFADLCLGGGTKHRAISRLQDDSCIHMYHKLQPKLLKF